MTGNVWEWTSSAYDGTNRVIRGGKYDASASYCEVTYRNTNLNVPSYRFYDVGFRLVMSQ
jgi:formylglycine-generating enzyme required for sulfatase activity